MRSSTSIASHALFQNVSLVLNFSYGLERFVGKVYQPSLNVAVSHRFSILALFATMGLLMAGYWADAWASSHSLRLIRLA
jgi:hypothetical protein